MTAALNDLIVGPNTPAAGVDTISLDFPASGWDASWVKLYKGDGETLLTLGADYTISGAGTASAVITLTTAATGADPYTATLEVPRERSADFTYHGFRSSAGHDRELDRLQQQIQLLHTELGQTIRAKLTGAAQHSIQFIAGRVFVTDTAGQVALTSPSPVFSVGENTIFTSLTAAGLATIDSDVAMISTQGVAEPGDGGAALYTRVDAEPSSTGGKFRSQDRYLSTGVEDATNGGWWRLISRPICPRQFAVDDDDAWTWMGDYMETEEAAGRWQSGEQMAVADEVDGRNLTYTLTADVTIAAAAVWRNFTVEHQGAVTVTVGLEGSGASKGHVFRDMTILFTGSADFAGSTGDPGTLWRVPRTFGSRMENVYVDATNGSYRARIGFHLGIERGWGLMVQGSRFYGGECCIMVGYSGDHTGIAFIGNTVDHGSVMNAWFSNPNGLLLSGCNVEHSDGKNNIVITSQTDSASHVARDISIRANYMYNVSNGAGAGYDAANACILAGPASVPDTTGWWVAGASTGANTLTGLEVVSNYMVSDLLNIPVVITGLAMVHVWGNTYEFEESSGEQLFASFAGSGTDFHLGVNRKQNSPGTVTPSFTSSTTNPILVDFPGLASTTCTLEGETTAGTLTIDARNVFMICSRGIMHISAFLNWTAASGGAGDVKMTMPGTFNTLLSGHRTPCAISTANFAYPVQALAFSGLDHIRLYRQNSTTRIDWADVPASGNIHIQISYPIDAAS